MQQRGTFIPVVSSHWVVPDKQSREYPAASCQPLVMYNLSQSSKFGSKTGGLAYCGSVYLTSSLLDGSRLGQ